ncbi:hypothetical protein ABIB25_000232 [Nakamurella sp. UYEF19]|uniref:hypothetical protein n=1 Tax=Nakamurella sp. UYEF19 TaxID=1756392 RepID=UPI0033985510
MTADGFYIATEILGTPYITDALPNADEVSTAFVAASWTGPNSSNWDSWTGRYLSVEVAGGLTGRKFGIWCSRGALQVRSFRYEGTDHLDGIVAPTVSGHPRRG